MTVVARVVDAVRVRRDAEGEGLDRDAAVAHDHDVGEAPRRRTTGSPGRRAPRAGRCRRRPSPRPSRAPSDFISAAWSAAVMPGRPCDGPSTVTNRVVPSAVWPTADRDVRESVCEPVKPSPASGIATPSRTSAGPPPIASVASGGQRREPRGDRDLLARAGTPTPASAPAAPTPGQHPVARPDGRCRRPTSCRSRCPCGARSAPAARPGRGGRAPRSATRPRAW